MPDPTASEIATAALNAAKDNLTLGVTSYTHGNRTENLIDPIKAIEAARAARAYLNEEDYGITTVADMRNV